MHIENTTAVASPASHDPWGAGFFLLKYSADELHCHDYPKTGQSILCRLSHSLYFDVYGFKADNTDGLHLTERADDDKIRADCNDD